MDPTTIYGISKLAGERLCEYYFLKYGVDVRSIRYPGIISFKSPPGGGTTDYAIAIFHSALRGERYECFLGPQTTLPMIYMPDAIRATIELMDAPAEQVKIRSSYNVAGVSFNPEQLAEAITASCRTSRSPTSRTAARPSPTPGRKAWTMPPPAPTGAGKRASAWKKWWPTCWPISTSASEGRLMDMSVFDLFKIGIGPSSSHTVGPMVAARRFLLDNAPLDEVAEVKAELYGSLALTGVGHATDKAVLLGLMGETPQDVVPTSVDQQLADAEAAGQLKLLGAHAVPFKRATHLVFHMAESLPEHPNGMRFTLTRKDGSTVSKVITRWAAALSARRARKPQRCG
jgi:hypothetical protein